MRLKHLELQGFKTFASKTEFVFPTGITAVVGPNGSGKSNVADALRWVLGEQVFSVLRAKKTEDLIFTGGEGRPRSGMAEVYLTLDNSDGFFPIEFSEVVVGRRAYRDGENEYLLNGSKVRLRDISELLSKTGLARRTYTVIGQGLVDQALSINSEERRALFEEAAGIAMYRYKREDALRKLDETRRNLERVRDIVAEIGPRVRQLERQAQRVHDYARLSAELDTMQRTWFGYHWGVGQAALREAKNTVEAQSAHLVTRRSEMTEFNTRIEANRKQQFELRAQVNEWRRAASGLHTQAEALQRQLAVLTERARSLQQQTEQTHSDQATLEAQITAQTERVAMAEAELAEIIARRDTQAAVITAAQQALAERQVQRKEIQRSRAAAQNSTQQTQAALTDRRNRRTQLTERRLALEQDIEAHRQSIEAQTQQRAAIEAQGATIDADSATLEASRADLLGQIDALKHDLEAAREQAVQREAKLDQAQAAENRLRERYAVLSEVRASLSGFDAGTRAALSANLPGVRGVLATLITVAPEWERAIEAALGADIQSIVVDSWAVTQAVRDRLGEDGGRVSLLPLDAWHKKQTDQEPAAAKPKAPSDSPFARLMRRLIRPREQLTPAEPKLPDGLQWATDCLACGAAIRPAVEALLKNVTVVDSLAAGYELMLRLPDHYHVVTRNGEVLRPTGTVTLGRAAGSVEHLAREREWRELPAQIEAAAAETARAAGQHAAVQETIAVITQQQAGLTTQLQAADQSVADRTAQRRGVDRQIEDAQREIGWKQGLIDQVTAELVAIDDRDLHLRAEEKQLLADLTQLAESVIQADSQLANLPTEEFAAQVTALQAEAAVSEQLSRSQTNVVASYANSLEQMRSQLKGRADRLAQIDQEQQAIEQQLAELHQREASLRAGIASFAEKIDPAEKRLLDLEADQNRLETEERAARTRLAEMESLFNQTLVELARREEELNHLRTRIDEELGLVQLEMADLSGPQPLPLKPIVSELPTVESLPEGMEQELQRLKAHIRRLGPINPEAQAEYEETRQRFDFLTQQSVDLEQAIAQLQQVIGELDLLMQTSFRETFEAIAEEFKVMFQKLFAGGSAKLVLTDPENVAQTGIEVIARPPGKKQQGLALLSGGERSLAAAALMFAILKVKPPPFCILDETDAALDEANVGRFRDTVKSLSGDTQFVMITHNRGTIEAADTIYGISMGNDSASRAISLKLESIPASA